MSQDIGVKNIVLVHGAWADGSGWRPIYEILKADGYNVRMVQNPLTSLEDDVAATDRVLDRMDGPSILVGHSYGGAVISQAGDHEKVVGLVYVAAFVPDVGESPFGLIRRTRRIRRRSISAPMASRSSTSRPMCRASPMPCRRPTPSSCATAWCRSRWPVARRR